MFSPLPPSPRCELSDCILDLTQFGSLSLPPDTAELHFQIDFIPSQCPDQVFFGLVHLDATTQEPLAAMAIQLDWTVGQISDAFNGFGVLTNLDHALMADRFLALDEPVTLKLKVEKNGTNLIPSFQVGDLPLLYPAITTAAHTSFTGIAGAPQPGPDAAPFCLYPALWMVTQP
jgi:hypothetical protein